MAHISLLIKYILLRNPASFPHIFSWKNEHENTIKSEEESCASIRAKTWEKIYIKIIIIFFNNWLNNSLTQRPLNAVNFFNARLTQVLKNINIYFSPRFSSYACARLFFWFYGVFMFREGGWVPQQNIFDEQRDIYINIYRYIIIV